MVFSFGRSASVEDLAKVRAGAVQEHAHLARRDLHTATDLLMRQPFDTAQPKHLGLLVGQLSHAYPHAVHKFVGAGVSERGFCLAARFWRAVDGDDTNLVSVALSQPIHRSPG